MTRISSPCAATVMPVGAGAVLEHVQDTLDSVGSWMPGAAVTVVDETGDPELSARVRFPDITWLSSGRTGAGTGDGVLQLVLRQGYRHVSKHTDADVMVKMDTDAVITGPHPDRDGSARFAEQPHVSLLSTTCPGAARDFSSAARAVHDESRRLHRRPRPAARVVRGLVRRARRHGYEMAAHVLGGTSLTSCACLDALQGAGLLGLPVLARARVVEDHLLSLSVRAVGFEHGDLAVRGDPLAVARRGLPVPPQQVLADGNKVAHSVSDWGEQEETEARAALREHRVGWHSVTPAG